MKGYYNMQNLNKYRAYKNVADNYDHALDLVRDKRPVLGEPVVVPYYSPDVDDLDKRINLLFAVGSLNGEFAVFEPTEMYNLVSLSISPNIIFVGDSSTLVISAKLKDNASSIIITDENETQIASGSGTSLVGTTTVTPSSEGVLEYSVTAVVNGKTLSAKSHVYCVRPIYYGSGTDYTDATLVDSAKRKPKGKYTIYVNSANDYIYFVVPSSMSITNVSMNGLSMPMQETSVHKYGQLYTAYQSVNGYDVGTYNLDVE